MKCSLGISNFLEEISSLSHSVVSLYFFALIAEEGFLISPCYSLELCIQMGVSFLFSFAFHFSSFHNYLSGLLRQPFCFLHFFPLGDGFDHCLLYSVTNYCHSSAGTLSTRSKPWIYLSLSRYNHKEFNLGLVVFPTVFNLSLNLAIRSSWSEPQSAPSLVFADYIELLHLWLQRI